MSSTTLTTTHTTRATKSRSRHAKLLPSKSYRTFEAVMERSLNLLSLQRPVQKILNAARPVGIDLSDLSRAAIVLGVAAMDSYFTDVFAERLIPFLKRKGPTEALADLLAKSGLNARLSLELLSEKRPYGRVRRMMETSLDHHTTQKTEVIDKLFLAYGLRDFSQQIARLKKRKMLLRSISITVVRRNRIAHDGDIVQGRLCPIDLSDVKKWLTDILKYVSGADEILQRQLPLR